MDCNPTVGPSGHYRRWALFLAKMGVECFSMEAPEMNGEGGPPTASFLRGVITNLLNPNVYVFWLLIGGPLMASVVEREVLAPVAYALSFLVTLMMTTAAVAYAFHRASAGISEVAYKRLLACCGAVMLGFSAYDVRLTCSSFDFEKRRHALSMVQRSPLLNQKVPSNAHNTVYPSVATMAACRPQPLFSTQR